MATLWRDTASNLYLLGSIHCLSADEYPLSAQIESAYSESHVLVVESDSRNGYDQSLGKLPKDAALPIYRDKDLRGRVEKAAEDLGINFFNIRSAPLFVIADNLYRVALEKIGRKNNQGVDAYFLNRSAEDGKEVRELEDINHVPRRIMGMGFEVERDYLRMVLDEIQDLQEHQKKLVEAWKTGDLAALEVLCREGQLALPNEIIINERNRSWLPMLESFRNSDKLILAIVGACHLVGEGNLRSLLEGYGAHFEQI